MLKKLVVFFSVSILAMSQSLAQCIADAGVDIAICSGDSGLIGNPAMGNPPTATYQWTPTTNLSCANCPNPTVFGGANGTYVLTVTDVASSCVTTDSVFVVTNPSPNANFSFVGTGNCANDPVQFTNTSTGTNPTYLWTFTDPITGLSTTSTAVNPNQALPAVGNGVQYVQVSLTITSNGCTDTHLDSVLINQAPSGLLADPIDNFVNCSGGIFTLTVYDASTPTTNSNYTIDWGDGSTVFDSVGFPAAGLTHVYSTSGVSFINFIVTGTNGCTDTTQYLTANILNPSIGSANPGGTTGCAPLSLCFPLNNFSTNPASTTYEVNFGDGSPVQIYTHPPPDSVCHTYTTSSCGQLGDLFEFRIKAVNICDSSTATVSPIRVYVGPEANFVPDATEACVNTPVTMLNTTLLGFSGNCSNTAIFDWDFGDGTTLTTFTLTDPVHVYTAVGNYTVTLVVSNSCGPDSLSHDICIEAPLNAGSTASAIDGCAPFTVTYLDTTDYSNSCDTVRNWVVMFNGSPCLPNVAGYSFVNGTSATSISPEIQFTTPGNYTVQLSAINSCGPSSANQPVTVRTVPQISINPLGAVCAGAPVTPIGTAISCSSPITGYSWTLTGATPGSSTTLNPGPIVYPVAGTYPLSLTVTNGCGASTQNSGVIVNPIPPGLNPATTSPICETFTASFTSDAVAGITYQWTGPNGFTANSQNTNLTNAVPANDGMYYLQGVLGACAGPLDSVYLVVNPLPNVSSISTINLCENNVPLQLGGSPFGGTWTGTGISPGGIFDAAVAGIGPHNLTYTYSDPATGCTDSSLSIVTVVPLPVTNAGPDTLLCDQPIPVQLIGSPAGGTWIGPNISSTGIFTPNGLGTFIVTYNIVNSNNCLGVDTAIVIVGNGPTPFAGLDTAVCEAAPQVFFNGTPGGGAYSGSLITPAGVFTPSTSGVYDIVYSIGSGSCLSTDTLVATVIPLPVINPGLNQSVCIDAAPFNLNGAPAGGTWSGTGVTNPAGVFDPAAAGPGAQVLTYAYTDPVTNCSSSNTVIVTVNDLPVVDAGLDTVLCNQPIPVQINASPAGGFWSGPNITATGMFTPPGVGVYTVTYLYTDGNGCVNSDARDITVANPIPALAGADTSECVNGPNVQLTGAPIGGIWSGPFISSTGDFTPSTVGNHTVYYSYGNGNCLNTDSLIVTVNALPILNAGLDINACISDAPSNFIAAPLGGIWSGNGITDINLGTFDPPVAGLGPDTVIYFYTDAVTGCSNEDTLIATVHGLPVPSFTNPPIGCVNAPVAFVNTTTGGNSQVWNFGDGGTSIAPNPNYTYVAIGTYNVQLISTSAQGCVDSITQSIDIHDIPVADFSLTPDSACSPVNGTFTDLSSGQNMTYSWNFGNGQTSNVANPGPQTFLQGQLLDTTYTILLTVSNICGSSTHNETITALPGPVAIFGIPSNTACSPATISFINNSTGLPDNYAWDFGDGTTSTSGVATFDHLFTTGQNDTIYTISLIVSNSCGADTATNFVHILPNSVTAFFNASTLAGCGPLTVDFTNFTSGGTNYNWDFGDGNVSVSNNPTHTYMTPGTYTVSLIATDGCGTDTTFATIDVFPSPVISFTASPLSVCINEPINFTNNSVGLASTTWNFGDGGTSNLSNPSHSYSSSGDYYVHLTGTSTGNGCPSTDSLLINVKTNPIASFVSSPNQGCEALNVDFTNTSTDGDFYSWDFDDGNMSGSPSPSHTYMTAGTYNANLLVTNLNGCKDSVIQTITVHPLPIANFTFTTSNPCAVPGTANFTNTSTGAVSYEWDFSNGLNSGLTNPTTAYSSVGTYPITLIATNSFGCSDTIVQAVGFYTPAQANFTNQNDSVCEGEPLTFVSNSSFYDSIVWNFGNGNITDQIQVDITFPASGTYPISLIAYGGGGCNDTMAVNSTITIMPNPVADFEYVNVQLPDPASGTAVFTNTSINGDQYVWNFGDGATSTEVNPEHSYLNFNTYPVQLITQTNFGCVDSTEKQVIIGFPHGLFIPTAIHPESGDYDLSHFIPKGRGLKEYEILIFDDWGNLIWSSTALDSEGRPTEVWDGTYMGEIVQQDAYVWKVSAVFYGGEVWEGNDIRQGKAKRSGTITVLH